ncbi:MAG: hypothetical protein JWL69_3379 [Phycisphaerales bacterium]|nr:hypothetical protein [Phycisphaerales bacterium]MDB5356097.1 hypothetical protein [Phycisphaerales bacterium]
MNWRRSTPGRSHRRMDCAPTAIGAVRCARGVCSIAAAGRAAGRAVGGAAGARSGGGAGWRSGGGAGITRRRCGNAGGVGRLVIWASARACCANAIEAAVCPRPPAGWCNPNRAGGTGGRGAIGIRARRRAASSFAFFTADMIAPIPQMIAMTAIAKNFDMSSARMGIGKLTYVFAPLSGIAIASRICVSAWTFFSL